MNLFYTFKMLDMGKRTFVGNTVYWSSAGRPEEVAQESCQAFLEYLKSGSALDPWMADQILPYLAVSGQESRFTTSRVSQHLLTNAWVIKKFIPVEIVVKGAMGEKGVVHIRP
jgi:RNA 3'-terminal phosphate cyclase (ATP)